VYLKCIVDSCYWRIAKWWRSCWRKYTGRHIACGMKPYSQHRTVLLFTYKPTYLGLPLRYVILLTWYCLNAFIFGNITSACAKEYLISAYWRAILIQQICLSVCLSVRDVSISDEKDLTYRHNFFSPYGSPIILVLPASNIFTKFRRSHPL